MKTLFQAFVIIFLLSLNYSLAAQTVQTFPSGCAGNVEVTVTAPTCHDGDDGSIELNLLEDNGQTQVAWLNLPAIAITDANGSYALSPGIYRVRFFDGIGCTDTLTVQVPNPARLVDFDMAPEDVRCKNEQNGRIVLLPSDHTKVRKFYLNGQPKAANTAFIENLSPGFYEIKMEDINGCFQQRYADIREPEKLELRVQKSDVSCPGESDGRFSLGAEGGVGNYKFSLDGQPFQNVLAFDNLEPKQYTVLVKDGNQCITQRGFSIEEPPTPEMSFEQEDVSCPGGADAEFIVIIETVGLADEEDYEYSLDDVNYQPDSTFKNLKAGNYDVFARNSKGCVSNKLISIAEPERPEMKFDKEDVSCPGGADAEFIVIIETVGLAEEQDYEYSLNDVDYQPDSLFKNLSAGEYKVFARNQIGCTEQATVTIEEPKEANISFDKEDVTCPGAANGRFIVIIETVGLDDNEDYDFSLDGLSFQADSLFENMAAGVYEVFVRNSKNCIQTAYVNITQPTAPDVEIISSKVSCPGGADAQINVNIDQGANTNTYQYSLDGISYQSENQFFMLGSGIYTLYLKDMNGCLFEELFVINGPAMPLFDIDLTDVSCAGESEGSIEVVIISGQAPFSFSLDGENYQSSPQFDNLPAGQYSVYLKDSKGCIYASEVNLNEPPLLNNVFVENPASCGYANGYLTAMASGGKAGYQYLWNTGSHNSVASNLNAGLYLLTITDAAGCTLTDSIYLQNIDGPQLKGQTYNVSCFNMSDGAIDLQINAQVAIERIIWSTGAGQEDLLKLKSGAYSVTVADINHCTNTAHFNIEEPEKMAIDGEIQQDGNSGSLELEVNGGTAPYQYEWSTGSDAASIEKVLPGNYSVTVTDDQGCAASRSYSFQPDADQPLGDNILIYPNPAETDLHISFDLPGMEVVSLKLYDELGREMYRSLSQSLVNEVLTINVGSLPGAVYFLQVIVGDEALAYRVVVAR